MNYTQPAKLQQVSSDSASDVTTLSQAGTDILSQPCWAFRRYSRCCLLVGSGGGALLPFKNISLGSEEHADDEWGEAAAHQLRSYNTLPYDY